MCCACVVAPRRITPRQTTASTVPDEARRVIAEIKTDYENGGIGLAAADFDHDGDVDLALVKHVDGGKVVLLENKGNNRFY